MSDVSETEGPRKKNCSHQRCGPEGEEKIEININNLNKNIYI